jgi:hypothetical protein
LQAAPFQYTPLVVDLSLSLGVSGLSVGGTPVSMAASEATLDSGTAVMLVCRYSPPPGNLANRLATRNTHRDVAPHDFLCAHGA